MITRMTVENFRSLAKVDVPLRPLTVLIGPNDTGKSTFVDAVHSLVVLNRSLGVTDRFRMDMNKAIGLSARVGSDSDARTISLRITPDQFKFDPPAAHPIWAQVQPIERFRVPASGVVLECAGYSADEEKQLKLGEDGNRTAALLDYLLRKERKRFDKVETALRKMVAGLSDVIIETPNPSLRKVGFRFENNLELPHNAVSAGVRLCTFFAALAYHPRAPRTVLVEEPENGIHPRRLGEIINLLRELTRGTTFENQCQVILTTHSPYLLDQINAQEDQVLVFQRQSDGTCTATPLDEQKVATYSDDFLLGEIWTNVTEEGLVTPQKAS